MNTAERVAVRARALELIRNPKPRRLLIAAAAFAAGMLTGACAF